MSGYLTAKEKISAIERKVDVVASALASAASTQVAVTQRVEQLASQQTKLKSRHRDLIRQLRANAPQQLPPEDGTDATLILPDELLATVFSALAEIDPRTLLLVVPAVCRRWQDACKEHVAANVDLTWSVRRTGGEYSAQHSGQGGTGGGAKWWSPISDKALAVIVKRFASVQALSLWQCHRLSVDAIVRLGSEQLLSLQLDGLNPAFHQLRGSVDDCEGAVDPRARHWDPGWSEVIAGILKKSPNVEAVLLRHPTAFKDEYLQVAVAECPNLKWIDVPDSLQLTDSGVSCLASKSEFLQSLDVAGCTQVTNSAIMQVLKGCTNLFRLDICNTGVGDGLQIKGANQLAELLVDGNQFSSTGLACLFGTCPKLAVLSILNADGITTDAVLSAIGNACPCLSEVSIDDDSGTATDAGMKKIAEGCPQIEYLEINGLENITDIGLATMIEHCQNLKPNRLISGQKGDKFIEAVVKQHPDLISIDLSYSDVTDEGLKLLAFGCPDIASINLYSCGDVTDLGLAAMIEHCKSLKPEKLGSSEKGDAFAAAVASRKSAVETLGLADCAALTKSGFENLLAEVPDVQTLSLSGDIMVPGSLELVVLSWPNLVSISLSDSDVVTDSELGLLVKGCTSLEALNLTNCPAVTDIGLELVGVNCPMLSRLSVSDCKLVTDVGIVKIADCCRELEELYIYNCSAITQAGRKYAKRCCPQLQFTGSNVLLHSMSPQRTQMRSPSKLLRVPSKRSWPRLPLSIPPSPKITSPTKN